MDLVSNATSTCFAESDITLRNYIFRQEIEAYHNQLVYHENTPPTPETTNKFILGNHVKHSVQKPSNIDSNIYDNNQNMSTRAITPISQLNYLQQSKGTKINPKHVMDNNIKTPSINRNYQDMARKTISPISQMNYLQQSNQTIIDTEQVSCSRNPIRSPIQLNKNDGTAIYMPAQSSRENVREWKFAEKTTYCRPAVDIYSKQYIHKTSQRNARLKVLVKRLALVREKEKQRIAWNNYINSLRNKHIAYKSSNSKTIPVSMTGYTNLCNSEIIGNYVTRPSCTESRDSQYLLEDINGSINRGHENVQYQLTPRLPPTFISNRPYFTTNSQEHSMMLNFELPRYNYPNDILPRYDYPNHILPQYEYPIHTPPTRGQIFLDNENRHAQTWSKQSHKGPPPLKFIDVNKGDMRNMTAQTETTGVSDNSEKQINSDKLFKDKFIQDNSSVEIIKKKLVVSEVEVKYSQLSMIDRKLDELIYSINSFIDEIKSQKHMINMKNRREAINQTHSSSYLVECNQDPGEIKCRTMQDRAISNVSLCKGNRQEALYTILTEEMHKSDQVKRDIENIINKPNRSSSSLHITFDIPTKDVNIEIKDSVKVDHRSVCVNKISEHKRMTIAVNTDPLGLLALFRVSAEAVKQLLSFVPSIDYYSYISMLPLPAATHMYHYVCNICGAAFDRPSQLSDHIQRHSLGRTRDCCVCRHVLDSARQSGLFTCRHCGQKFTRAYCKELHQLSCARILGKEPDVSSSHIILR